jgi:hypothetical protein
VSFDAQNLIFRLINRNPAQRIGASEEGVEEIKLDWPSALERQIEPEWKPKVDLECVGAGANEEARM